MSDSESINPGDFDIVAGFDPLTISADKCIKGVKWKATPAAYFLNNIEENLKLESQLKKGEYKQRKTKHFKVTYPKERDIVSVAYRDRVFQRSLNDNIIYPRITRSFIYDNMACQTGKGPDRARERLDCFLHRFYRKHGIEGYVLKCDLKGYYPNMSHKVVRDCFHKVIKGWTYQQALMVLDGQYEGEKGYNPGSQMIQIAGIGILDSVDHFIKEELHIEFYIRYMDDFIMIHHEKQYLTECQARIAQKLQSLECSFNTKKTNITPLSKGVTFLGFHFRLTKTGKVIKIINPENVKHERKKLQKLVHLALKNGRTKAKVDECYNSWKSYASKGNSAKLLARMDIYYQSLWDHPEWTDDVRRDFVDNQYLKGWNEKHELRSKESHRRSNCGDWLPGKERQDQSGR